MENSLNVGRDLPLLLGSFAICLAVCFWCGYELLYGVPEEIVGKWSFIFKDSQQAYLFCFVILSVFILALLKMIIDSKVVMTIDEQGFYDRRFLKGTIAWSDIEAYDFVTQKMGMSEMEILVLQLRKFSKQSVRFTWFHYANALMWTHDDPNIVQFHLNGLDVDFPEIQVAINNFRHVRQANHIRPTSNKIFG